MKNNRKQSIKALQVILGIMLLAVGQEPIEQLQA